MLYSYKVELIIIQIIHMKKLACRDMGMNCDFVAMGMTDEEVMQKLDEHGKATHPNELAEMAKTMSTEQMGAMMKSKIKDEPGM